MSRWRKCPECGGYLPQGTQENQVYCKTSCARKAAWRRSKEKKEQGDK